MFVVFFKGFIKISMETINCNFNRRFSCFINTKSLTKFAIFFPMSNGRYYCFFHDRLTKYNFFLLWILSLFPDGMMKFALFFSSTDRRNFRFFLSTDWRKSHFSSINRLTKIMVLFRERLMKCAVLLHYGGDSADIRK